MGNDGRFLFSLLSMIKCKFPNISNRFFPMVCSITFNERHLYLIYSRIFMVNPFVVSLTKISFMPLFIKVTCIVRYIITVI